MMWELLTVKPVFDETPHKCCVKNCNEHTPTNCKMSMCWKHCRKHKSGCCIDKHTCDMYVKDPTKQGYANEQRLITGISTISNKIDRWRKERQSSHEFCNRLVLLESANLELKTNQVTLQSKVLDMRNLITILHAKNKSILARSSKQIWNMQSCVQVMRN